MIKKAIRSVCVSAILAIASNCVMAQGNAWYVAGGLGASFANDVDIKQLGATITTDFDTGIIGSLAIGHSFESLRIEGEFAYMQNDVSSLKAFGIGVDASGDVSAASLMANVYYDFDTGSKWKPFIGAGAGYSNVSINNLSSSGFLLADDDTGVFAYQLKAGIGYAFTDKLDGTVGYRFFGTADGDFVDSTGLSFTADGLQNHVIELGVRYRF